jgi:hypothetical protein
MDIGRLETQATQKDCIDIVTILRVIGAGLLSSLKG